MESIEYAYGDRLLRLDDEVIELFGRVILGSLRLPLRWASVELEPRKGDVIRVSVGISPDAGGPFYISKNLIAGGHWQFDVPVSEESRLRQFFDEAARRGGRPG